MLNLFKRYSILAITLFCFIASNTYSQKLKTLLADGDKAFAENDLGSIGLSD
jgi:uncharacterized membrane protein